MKKIIISILLIGIIASCGFVYTNRIYAEEMNDSEMQNAVNDVDTITKDYDFEDDKVIVVMNETESLKFKNYTPQDFSEVGCVEIVELMPYTSATIKEYIQKYSSLENAKLKIENETLINVNDFRVILSLTLLVKDKENVLSAVDILKQRTDIEAVEPNYIIAYNSMADDNAVHSNEQEYLNCWGNKKIKTKQAHTITKGDPTVYVGIMDTGIDSTHDYLKEALAHDLHKDYTRIDGPLVDTSNHGTTVAGVVASVAPNVKLVSLKIKYSSLMFGLSESIDYAIEKKIGILNFSHGSFEEYNVDALLTPLKIYKGLFAQQEIMAMIMTKRLFIQVNTVLNWAM